MIPFSSLTSDDVSSDELEKRLWRDYLGNGSSDARERLFVMHADFARSIAARHRRQYRMSNLDIGELRQLAYVGLLEAMERFDPARGVPFRGFAARRIAGNILDGISRIDERSEQINWRRRLRRERMQSLTDEELGDKGTADILTAIADLAVGLALGFMLEGTGMIASSESDGGATAQSPFNAYESAAWNETIDRLQSELLALSDREQTILRHHYIDGLPFETLADLLQLSKARISQIHRLALSRLRKRMTMRGHFRVEH